MQPIELLENQRQLMILELTPEMVADIDKALLLNQDTLVRSRQEFIRAACQYALDAVFEGIGDPAANLEERKRRVLLAR